MDFKNKLQNVNHFDVETLDHMVKQTTEEKQIGLGQVMTPLRLVLVGSAMGPGVTLIMSLLGKFEVINRIDIFLKSMQQN
jgi:glutamyl-tRNA synthetase